MRDGRPPKEGEDPPSWEERPQSVRGDPKMGEAPPLNWGPPPPYLRAGGQQLLEAFHLFALLHRSLLGVKFWGGGLRAGGGLRGC